jgi:hypothetical protein
LHDTAKAGTAKNADNDELPKEDIAVMLIFGGTPACPPKRKHKRILQEIYHIDQVVVV